MKLQQEEAIHFHNTYGSFYLPDRTFLKQFIRSLFKNEGKTIESINYIFCNDDELLTINQQYLNHNTLTDIITFELSEKNQPAISDIYISIDRVKENAKIFNIGFIKELYRVLFHGALHLCGYKDKKASDQKMMRNKENHYLNLYLVSRGTRNG